MALTALKSPEAAPCENVTVTDCFLESAASALKLGTESHGDFRNIVFAQAKIAAVNAFFTWIYLGVVLPLVGVKLPFAGTLVIITFVAGLIPILGNILSNSAIVIVSLGYSFQMAMTSLLFLVSIHKLEYFLNAKIVGSQIKANAWELLTAMLVMEAAFGLPGLVAAPVYYAYLKSELKEGVVI